MTDKGKVRIPIYLDLKDVEVPFIESLDRKQSHQVIVDIDCEQADVDFTVDVVTDLAISVSEEVAADEGEKKPMLQFWAFGKPNYVHPDQVVAALATEPPARIIEIMGRALAEARKMAAGADELLDSPCTHEGDCGCSEAQIDMDALTGRDADWGPVTVENGPDLASALRECWCGHEPRMHTPQDGCIAHVYVDALAAEQCECVAYNTADWTTPKGILRLEKLVKKQARSDCDGCGHVLSAHNGGEAYNVCLPGFPNEGCMACTMNEKEK